MSIPGFKETWFMFGRTNPIAENTLTRVKDTAIEKAEVKRIFTHELRHSHASNLLSNGMNIMAVSKRLGHSDMETTLRIYAHLIGNENEDDIDECLERMNKDIIKKESDE